MKLLLNLEMIQRFSQKSTVAAFIEAFKATRDTMTNALVTAYKFVGGLSS